MIKRKYFINGKVSHNNNTGMYSYYSGLMVIPSWLELSAEDIVEAASGMVYDQVTKELDKHGVESPVTVELQALNKV